MDIRTAVLAFCGPKPCKTSYYSGVSSQYLHFVAKTVQKKLVGLACARKPDCEEHDCCGASVLPVRSVKAKAERRHSCCWRTAFQAVGCAPAMPASPVLPAVSVRLLLPGTQTLAHALGGIGDRCHGHEVRCRLSRRLQC